MGKMKIEGFVKALCATLSLTDASSSSASIGRLIKRKHYFFAGKPTGKRVKQNGNKQRVRLCPNSKDQVSGYIQLDGVKFYYLEKYYYFLTAVDIVSKQAWLKIVPSLKSLRAAKFLEEIIQTAWYKVHTIQTDNGSEFESFFGEAVKEAKLTPLWNYPRHPKTTGYVERFNWTIQDEFLFETGRLSTVPGRVSRKTKYLG